MLVGTLAMATLAGCGRSVVDGAVEDEDWGVATSEVDAVLSVPCADERGGDGTYRVLLDDRSGYAALVEEGEGRVWLRDGFGAVSDRCWWLVGNGSMPQQDCVDSGGQDGTCTADADVPDSARFVHPGVALADGLGGAAADEGVLLGLTGDGLARLDLTTTADPPIDRSEGPDTRLDWLPSLDLPKGTLATGDVAVGDAVVAWDRDAGQVDFFDKTDARSKLEPTKTASAPGGDGALAAAGGYAVVATDARIDVWSDVAGHPKRDRRRTSALKDGVLAAAVDPDDGTAYVLVPDAVLVVPKRGDVVRVPTFGAKGLFLGRPAGVPTAYAWGDDDQGGVLWRIDAADAADGSATASAWHVGGNVLGAGTGETFQEIVVVREEADGAHVSGYLDHRHLDAIAPGTVRLAMAAFAESPRDPDFDDGNAVVADAQIVGCDDGSPTEQEMVCCVQEARGERADAQLAWLDQRLSPDWPGGPAAVILGVNPTAVEQTRRCDDAGHPADELPTVLAKWIADWSARGVASAGVFGHSIAKTEDGWWQQCDGWSPSSDECWNIPKTPEAFASFYQKTADAASLAAWGDEPDWRWFGGAYEDASFDDVVDWTDVFPDVVTPDGAVAEDGLYFGELAMDPRTPEVLHKELSPDDARERPFPVDVATPADKWDVGGGTGTPYWPGQTFALPYLYELRQSGLAFLDYGPTASPTADWSTPIYDGDEGPGTMNRADFAMEEQYLVGRVLADKDVTTPRFWYFHLQDVSAIHEKTFADGWIDCDGDCATDTELDRFLVRIEGWQPQVQWAPEP